MRRYDELSKDQEPLLPHQFCSDCITATRGYDFREGQGYAEGEEASFARLPTLGAACLRHSAVRPSCLWMRDIDVVGIESARRCMSRRRSSTHPQGRKLHRLSTASIGQDAVLQSRVHNLNIEMSADRFKSVWESLARRVAKWITTKQ